MTERLLRFVDALEPTALVQLGQRFRVAILILVIALVYLNEVTSRGPDILGWDHMFASGYATLAVGIALAQGLSGRMAQTVERLMHRGALEGEGSPDLLEVLQRKAGAWSHRGGLMLAVLLLGLYVWANTARGPLLSGLLETVLAVIAGYIVGRVLGRMVCYGFLGAFLHSKRATVTMQPGHPDGAAGLKPLGDFYFFQAMLLALPIAFVAVWVMLIPIWSYHDYTHWQGPYLTLLIVGLAIEIGAFVLPMWTIHQDMVRGKAALQDKADALGREIVTLRAKLTSTTDAQAQSALNDQVDLLGKQYEELEHVPTWPVDLSTRRRFAASNLAMFLPVVVQTIGATGPWQRLADVMERFLAQPS